MIISASRRTDIPAFYSDWFFNRIAEGYVLVRNPVNRKKVSSITLSPQTVDCIVFWTKNPGPMLDKFDKLKQYNYYFQITITPYDNSIEKSFSDKRKIIENFKILSNLIGPNRVLWRYDPVFINDIYSVDFHKKAFEGLVYELKGYTKTCTISFVDLYKSINKRMMKNNIVGTEDEDIFVLAKYFSNRCNETGMKIYACSEPYDFLRFGIEPAKCIDPALIETIFGCELNISKDKNQRKECGCAKSVDIGAYDTCPGGCVYCYANHSSKAIERNLQRYTVKSKLLCDNLNRDDSVYQNNFLLI